MALLWGERHVAAIRVVHGDGTATVYDANSGGVLTRIHRISLAGLVVVDSHVGQHGEPTFASLSPPHVEEQPSPIRVADHREERKVVSYPHAPAAEHSVTHVAYRHRPVAQHARATNRPTYQNQARVMEGTWREARLETANGFWH